MTFTFTLALGTESSSSSTYPCIHPSVQVAIYSLVCLSIHPHPFIIFPFHHSCIDPTLWLPRRLSGKESTCQCRSCRFDPWIRKIPWRRKWQPTPDFSPEKSHGLRNLVGYGPWRVEQDLETKQLLPLVVMYVLQEGLRDGVEIQKL